MTTAIAQPKAVPENLPPSAEVTLNRRALLAALGRVERVVAKRSCKPILQGVRLDTQGDRLRLTATDLDMSILVSVPTSTQLPACVVSCAELTKRIKASKSKDCTLQFDADRDALLVNGGCVEHVLRTLDAAEFPVVPDQAVGDVLRVRTDELKAACHIAQIAVAKEPSRYAIDGVLLESDGHAIWLVATDGRRLVEIELEPCACQFTGQVILPGRLTALITRLADPKRDPELAVYVQPQPDSEGTSQPARLFVAGCDWLVSTIAVDGMFPKYQDYIPKTGKRFIVDRQRLLATLDEVALATDFDCKAVCVELSAKQVHIAAASHANGTARGTVPADCPNASSRTIRTGFNALLLQDAVKSLTAERMVIDLQPNQRSKVTGNPIQQPALFYGEHEPRVRWLIMPVSVD